MKQLLILYLLALAAPAWAQDPAEPINKGLSDMGSYYRLYPLRDSKRLDSLYRGTLGGGYVTYGGADARYRRTLAPLDYYLDIANRPTLFSGNYQDLTNKPVIPTLPSWVTPTDPGYALSSSLGSMSNQSAGAVSIAGGTATLTSLNLPVYNTAGSQLRVGSLEMQGYDAGQSFIAHNAFVDAGIGIKRRQSGTAGIWMFLGNEGQFRFANSGFGYSNALATQAQMKVDANGNWGVGYNMPIEAGDYTNSIIRAVGGSGNVLINTTVDVPSSKLTINSTTQGVLFPRLTTAQINAITLPADGLYVYDVTLHVHKYYNAAASTWKIVATTN